MSEFREPVDVRVARRLRTARLNARLTVREAAEQAGFDDHSPIVRYENGTTRPPLERLEALAGVYGLTLAALLAETDAAMPLIVELERAARRA